jgi:5-methylcytosine-specific restriction endonuclease McrA
MLNKFQNELHLTALNLSKQFHQTENELLEVLGQIDEQKVYLQLGYSSLFQYSVSALGLSEQKAYALMKVSRKSKEIPELKANIQNGSLSVSKAIRIVSVIKPGNQKVWIEKAKTLPKVELEKEIASLHPEVVTKETVRRLDENRSRISLSLPDELLQEFKRAQTLESMRNKKSLNLEETLQFVLADYLERRDPVRKAKRICDKALLQETSEASVNLFREIVPTKSVSQLPQHRRPLPAFVKHQVFQRDQGKCQFKSSEGLVCHSREFVQIHHVVSVSKGGTNHLSNLQTLCSRHHAYHHQQQDQRDHRPHQQGQQDSLLRQQQVATANYAQA